MKATIDRLVADLAGLGTADRAVHEKKYLKSELDHLGVTVPDLRKKARQFAKDQPAIVAEPWPFVQACWGLGIYELRSFAAFFLEHAQVSVTDADRFEALLRDSHTWAIVDQLAVQVIGPLHLPAATLDRWAKQDDFWLRRASVIEPLRDFRAGKGDVDAWAKRVVPMLDDPQFFIRKAIGWALREIGKKRPAWTQTFVDDHAMSALTRREAVRNLWRA